MTKDVLTDTAFSLVDIIDSNHLTKEYGKYVIKNIIPPQAAATLAREKNTLIKKHIIMVDIIKTTRKRKTINPLLFVKMRPNFMVMTSNMMLMSIRMELLTNHATQ